MEQSLERGADATPTEAVARFTSIIELEDTADELLESGFDWAELSVPARGSLFGRSLPGAPSDARQFEDDPDAPRAGLLRRQAIGEMRGAIIATLLGLAGIVTAARVGLDGGSLETSIIWTAVAALIGAAIGYMASLVIDRWYRRYVLAQLAVGGLVLWVRTRDRGHERKALEVLDRHAAADIHLHPLPG